MLTTGLGLTAYVDGQTFLIRANFTNTGAATISVDELGATSLTKFGAVALAVGDIVSGRTYLIARDTTGPRFQVLNVAPLDAFVDPGADQLIFWDDSASDFAGIATLPFGWAISGTALLNEEPWAAALSDETTALTAATNVTTFVFPYAVTVLSVGASVNTVSSSGGVTVDVNENGATILSTKITIDQGEKTSLTAVTPAVISDAAIAAGTEVGFDIDTAGTGAKGLKAWMIVRRTS